MTVLIDLTVIKQALLFIDASGVHSMRNLLHYFPSYYAKNKCVNADTN